jgi:hypothetical protein
MVDAGWRLLGVQVNAQVLISMSGAIARSAKPLRRSTRYLNRLLKLKTSDIKFPKSIEEHSWATPETSTANMFSLSTECIVVEIYEKLW